jgi:hypothetical protein
VNSPGRQAGVEGQIKMSAEGAALNTFEFLKPVNRSAEWCRTFGAHWFFLL